MDCTFIFQNADLINYFWTGIGLGDILKPDLVMPLIETLPLEQTLAAYLPEVGYLPFVKEEYKTQISAYTNFSLSLQGSWSTDDLMELLQSPPFRQQVDSFSHVCDFAFYFTLLRDIFSKVCSLSFYSLFSSIGAPNRTDRLITVWN